MCLKKLFITHCQCQQSVRIGELLLKTVMYSPDKMMGVKGPTGIHGPITSTGACFAGRYSPTYRSPEPMTRRCMPNPSVSLLY